MNSIIEAHECFFDNHLGAVVNPIYSQNRTVYFTGLLDYKYRKEAEFATKEGIAKLVLEKLKGQQSRESSYIKLDFSGISRGSVATILKNYLNKP